MVLRLVCALLVLVGGVVTASAAPDASGVDCAKAITTVELGHCADQDASRADARLNAAYRRAMAAIAASDLEPAVRQQWRDGLLDAQRKWIAFRDAECAVTGFAWYGGSGAGMAISGCLATLTEARTKQLTEHAER